MKHWITEDGEIVCRFHHPNLIESYTDLRLIEGANRGTSAYGHESSVGFLAEIAWLCLIMPNLCEASVLGRWSAEPIFQTLDTARGTEIKSTGTPASYRKYFPNVYVGKTTQLETAQTFVFAYCDGIKKVPIADPDARGIQPHGVRLDAESTVTFVEYADMEALRGAGWNPYEHVRSTGFTSSVCFRGVCRPAGDHPSLDHL